MDKKLSKVFDVDVIQELNLVENIIKYPNSLTNYYDSNILVKNLKNNVRKVNQDRDQDSTISIFNYTITKLDEIKNDINKKWFNVFNELNNYNNFCAVEQLNYNEYIILGYNNKDTSNSMMYLPQNSIYKININQIDTTVKIIQETFINDSLLLNSFVIYKQTNQRLNHKKISLNNNLCETQEQSCVTAYYSSNIFCFSGRNRRVIMTIPVKNYIESDLEFQIFLSTENGWEEVVDFEYMIDSNGKLLLTIDVEKDFPMLVIPNIETHSIEEKNPVIKFVATSKFISSFFSIEYESVEFKVISYENKNIIVSNDNGEIDHLNLFWPFGYIPEIGKQLNIGSHEIWNKNCEFLHVKIVWKDVPLDIKKRYENYEQNINQDSFKALINLKFSNSKENEKFSLFSSTSNNIFKYDNLIVDVSNSCDNNNFCTLFSINVNNESNNSRFFKIESQSDNLDFLNIKLKEPKNFALGHAFYDQLIIDEIIENNNKKNKKSWFKNKEVTPKITISKYEPPFTPQIEDIYIDFSLIEERVSLKQLKITLDDSIINLHPSECNNLGFEECLIIQVKHIVKSFSFFFEINNQNIFQFLSTNGVKVYVGNMFKWEEVQDDEFKDLTCGLNISGTISFSFRNQYDRSFQFIKIVIKEEYKNNYNNVFNIIENPIYASVEKLDANDNLSMNEDMYLFDFNLIGTWGMDFPSNKDAVSINHYHNNENKFISRNDIIKFLKNKYHQIQEVSINKRESIMDFQIYFRENKIYINYLLINDIYKDIQDKLYDKSIQFQLFIVTNP